MDINVTVNGKVISAREAIGLLTKITTKPVYFSKSKEEYLVIQDMATSHIKNALSKKARDYFSELTKVRDLETYLDQFVAFAREPEVAALYNELVTRVDED